MARILIANPSSDVYGSDLQMLESVKALVERGHSVDFVSPDEGPLLNRLVASGATTSRVEFPVMRRRNASVIGLAELLVMVIVSLPRMIGVVRRIRPDIIYVNTMTIPWWSLVGRLMRLPVVVHVHEAESDDPRVVRLGLNLPLLAATRVIVNSLTSLDAMTEVVGSLKRRAVLIHNGVDGPESIPDLPSRDLSEPRKVAVIGRLSPRKATDVALRAVAQLRHQGLDVNLVVAGTAFEGYEWYVRDLEDLALSPDLEGSVTFLGYVNPVWPVLFASEVVVAPSVRESLGNAVIEAQLAQRPVIATETSGHLESVDDGVSGILVPVGDVDALATAIRRLLEDQQLANALASQGRASAQQRFAPERYKREIVDLVERMVQQR